MPPGVEVLQVADLRLAAGFGLHIHAAEVVVFAVLGGETALDVTRVGIFDRAAVLHVEGVDQTQRGTYGTHTGGRTGSLGNRVDHPGVTLAVVIPRDGALVDRTEDDLRVPAVVEEVVVGFVGVEILRIHAYVAVGVELDVGSLGLVDHGPVCFGGRLPTLRIGGGAGQMRAVVVHEVGVVGVAVPLGRSLQHEHHGLDGERCGCRRAAQVVRLGGVGVGQQPFGAVHQFADVGGALVERRAGHVAEVGVVAHLLFDQHDRAVLAQQQEVVVTAQEERFAQVAVLEVLRQVAAFTHVVFENERRTDGPVEGVPFDIERCRRLPDTEVDVVGRVYGPRNVALVGASQPGVVLVQTVHGQRRVAVREILHDLGAVAPDHFVGLHVVGFFVEILATREHCSSYKQIKYFFHRSSVLD